PNERARRERARSLELPVVAVSEVLYHSRARRPLQDVLTCVRRGVPLASAGRRLRENAEHDLLPAQTFARRFGDDPAAVARSADIAERCTFSLAELRYRYPAERLPDGKSSSQWLRHLVEVGARSRYGSHVPPRVIEQLSAELALIEE